MMQRKPAGLAISRAVNFNREWEIPPQREWRIPSPQLRNEREPDVSGYFFGASGFPPFWLTPRCREWRTLLPSAALV